MVFWNTSISNVLSHYSSKPLKFIAIYIFPAIILYLRHKNVFQMTFYFKLKNITKHKLQIHQKFFWTFLSSKEIWKLKSSGCPHSQFQPHPFYPWLWQLLYLVLSLLKCHHFGEVFLDCPFRNCTPFHNYHPCTQCPSSMLYLWI